MSYRRWIPSALWAAFILVLTSIPLPETVATTAPAGTDKVVHFGLYAVLGLLLTSALGRYDPPWRGAATIVAAVALFAAMDELHQILVPGRFASVVDWLADVAGAGAGAAAATLRASRREWQS